MFLITGSDDGKKCWHYVQVEKTRIPFFEKEVADGNNVDLESYGRILIAGWGENPPTKVKDKIKEEGTTFSLTPEQAEQRIFFIKNRDQEGKPFYSFVGVPTYLAAEFERKCMGQGFNLEDYGFIIYSGWGNPPETVIEVMESLYNFDRNLIAEFIE